MLRPALLLLLVLLTACASLGSGDGNRFVLNERVAEALKQPDYTLQRGRSPLVMRSGQSVESCAAYLDAGGHAQVAEDMNSRITARQYLICDIVMALKDARALDDEDYRPEAYGKVLRDRLDLRSFDSSAADYAGSDDYTLGDLDGVRTRASDHAVAIEHGEWFLVLDVVANGHFDGNDQPDWLVRLIDESKSGLQRSYRVLIIRDVSAGGSLTAEPYTL